jgi:2-haloacid dehalogenase
VPDRWATFDCYGTLVDWNGGIRHELARLFGDGAVDRLLGRYHQLEPQIQVEDPSLSYRQVLIRGLERLAAEDGVQLAAGERDALPRSLPDWPVFPEVPAALSRARVHGWRLGVLSNSDPDLIGASIERIGVPFDAVIVASQIGSYKPAHGHWLAFQREVGRLPDVHIAASLFHDIGAAQALGIPSVWINRLAEATGRYEPTRQIPDLAPLPDTLDELRTLATG